MLQNYKNVELVKPGGLELKDRLVGVQRVTKVTKGGRAFGFSAIVVVGDENGVVGQGLGKSKEVAEAISKAVEDAKKNLVRIPINKGTVPHEQKGKYGGARVFLEASFRRYRSYRWWSCKSGIRGSRSTQCTFKVSRIIKSSQCSQSYFRCIITIEKCQYHC